MYQLDPGSFSNDVTLETRNKISSWKNVWTGKKKKEKKRTHQIIVKPIQSSLRSKSKTPMAAHTDNDPPGIVPASCRVYLAKRQSGVWQHSPEQSIKTYFKYTDTQKSYEILQCNFIVFFFQGNILFFFFGINLQKKNSRCGRSPTKSKPGRTAV